MLKSKLISLTLLVVLLLSACNFVSTPSPEDPIDPLRTAAAATVVAMTTQVMQTQMAIPKATPTFPVLTLPPLATQLVDPNQPLETVAADASSTPSASCDLAEFVEETVPDGTKFPPSTSFTKAWTLKNVGTCAWTPAYEAVFLKGDSMSAPAAQSLTTDRILPGQTVTIHITFTTPSSAGNYRADFLLRNANGVLFSFNNTGSTFWVDINVTG